MTIDVKDASGEVVTLPTLPPTGQASRAGSLPTTLATEDLAAVLSALGLLGTEAKLEAVRLILAGSKTDLDGILTAVIGLATGDDADAQLVKLEAIRLLLAATLVTAPSADQDPIFNHAAGKKTTGLVSSAGTTVLITPPAGCKYVRISAEADILIRTDGPDVADDDAAIRIIANQPEVVPVTAAVGVKGRAVTGTTNVRCTPMKVR